MCRVEEQIANWMDVGVEPPQNLAGCPSNVRLLRLASVHSTRTASRATAPAGGLIGAVPVYPPLKSSPGKLGIGRDGGTSFVGVLRVDTVELPVARIVRIECKSNQAARIAGTIIELGKDFLKVDVGRERTAGFLEDVQIAIQVVDEETNR